VVPGQGEQRADASVETLFHGQGSPEALVELEGVGLLEPLKEDERRSMGGPVGRGCVFLSPRSRPEELRPARLVLRFGAPGNARLVAGLLVRVLVFIDRQGREDLGGDQLGRLGDVEHAAGGA
jgi:hypothetical protein